MRSSFRFFVAIITVSAAAPVAVAQDVVPKLQAEQDIERLKERAALERARADIIAARLEPMKGLAGEGKVTLGEGAGQTEAWLLSSDAVGAAAAIIAGQLGSGPHVILAGDEALSFKPLTAFGAESSSLQLQLAEAVGGAPKSCGGGGDLNIAAAPIIPLIAGIASSLRTDTEVRGVPVEAKDRLLATALARRLAGRALIPAALTAPDEASSTAMQQLGNIRKLASTAARVSRCLATVKKPSEVAKTSAAELTAALARATTFQTAIGTPDASGSPPLANLLVLEALKKSSPTVVRVHLDKANGTLITRRNLWTALGAQAVAVSGGVVASFTATKSASGTVTQAGVVRCTTRLAGLRSIQTNTAAAANCRLVEGEGR
ncbi:MULTISPECIES: hypothetical protein [Sphingobium]|nr:MULTISPECIES: hypothetical protein [Sphingobium]WQE08800.1 hypothetical protein U0025_07965 [Sphingobium yanoikuyae]